MLMPSVLPFWRSGTRARKYHSTIHEHIQADALIQRLPTLLTLPLYSAGVVKLSAATIQDAITRKPYLAVRGPSGSGRSLLLLQLAWHWTTSQRKEPVLPLCLYQCDKPNVPPRAVLANALHHTDMPMPINSTKGTTIGQPWILLIDDWDKLPPSRRAAWRSFILSLPKQWPEARVLITLPAASEKWKGFHTINLATPDETLSEVWIQHLLRQTNIAPIRTVIQNSTGILSQHNRLLDSVLLALTYPVSGLPVTRLQLYERAYALIYAPSEHAGSESVVVRHYTNPTHHSQHLCSLAHHTMRNYEIAHALATANDIPPLDDIADADRTELALLLRDMLPDPDHLYTTLWGNEEHLPTHLLILAECICQAPTQKPAWAMRTLKALVAQQTTLSYRHMLKALLAHLPAILNAAYEQGTSQTTPLSDITALLTDGAPTIEATSLLTLLDATDIHPDIRWAATDAFLARKPAIDFYNTSPPDTLAQAMRGYILVMQTTDAHQPIRTSTKITTWIAALQDAHVPQQRRLDIATILLNQSTITPVLRATALALQPQVDEEATYETLKRMCSDTDAAVRHTALCALHMRETRQALSIIGHILLTAKPPWQAQHDALESLAEYQDQQACKLLAQCTLSTKLPMIGRCRAVILLAAKNGDALGLLRRLTHTDTAHPLIRSIAIRMVVQRATHSEAYALLHSLIQHLSTTGHTVPLLVCIEAIHAMGQIASRVADNRRQDVQNTIHYMHTILEQNANTMLLKTSLVQALGASELPGNVATLCHILQHTTHESMHTMWLSQAPRLAELPPSQWPNIAMPPNTRVALFTIMTESELDAEQPGSLQELCEHSAMYTRIAAADALVRIGQGSASSDNPAIRQDIQTALHNALHQAQEMYEIRHMLACLFCMSQDNGLSTLESLLSNLKTDIRLCWLAIEHGSTNPLVVNLYLRYLEQKQLDPCTRGKMVEALQHHISPSELPHLHHIAAQQDEHIELRIQAISTLGHIGTPAAIDALVELIDNNDVPVALRSAAIKALPTPLSEDIIAWLRESLYEGHVHHDLIAPMVHALGRAKDQKALTLMLRYAQFHHKETALAALAALRAIGDVRIVSTLAHIAHNTSRDPEVRLQATVTLIHLGSHEHVPLLRSFLDNGPLALQLQALDYMMTLLPDDAQPFKFVADQKAPFALRLRVLERATTWDTHIHTLCDILLDTQEVPQLRAYSAKLLGHTSHVQAVEALAQCVWENVSHPYLIRRCIAALEEHIGTQRSCAMDAQLALGQIADAPSLPDEIQMWAALALIKIEERLHSTSPTQMNWNRKK